MYLALTSLVERRERAWKGFIRCFKEKMERWRGKK